MKRSKVSARATFPGTGRGRVAATDEPRLQVSFRRAIGFGPGKVQLLEAIGEVGSISGAARRIGMSYKRAWDLVAEMNAQFRQPLVVTNVDGRRLGGATLTEDGRQVLALFGGIQQTAAVAIAGEFSAFCDLLDAREDDSTSSDE